MYAKLNTIPTEWYKYISSCFFVCILSLIDFGYKLDIYIVLICRFIFCILKFLVALGAAVIMLFKRLYLEHIIMQTYHGAIFKSP